MNNRLHYRVHGRPGSVFPGAHSGHWLGAGQLFSRHEGLLASPDPRRIDLRASVLDPFDNYRIRVYQQPGRIDVYVLADLSASMAYVGKQPKQRSILEIARAIAGSAQEYGDRFGFIGCTKQIEPGLFHQASREFGRIKPLLDTLADFRCHSSAQGLSQTAALLPGKRAMVFLLSDFHLSEALLNQTLSSLQRHDVVPLVLWDENEYQHLPPWGLMSVTDMESSAKRRIFMRPALREKIRQGYAQRRLLLQARCRSYGMEPLFLSQFEPGLINAYFHQRAA